MMAQPLHLMQRRTFLEPSRHGNAAAALEAVDARIVKLREQVELATQRASPTTKTRASNRSAASRLVAADPLSATDPQETQESRCH